ncbi:winged helix-turn-helix domain-containing protein [Thalassomonas viridans]|uniref:Winged helix-turn-helix domain-containing protein n=1 Tax=Thalassomonas viridans TaxID=137584 RepID=A0AAE9Z580_9GAMM|nr:winged helix-turn-helix domain-containing protein [Thalassomonas viridans]WDE06880.1 winged helix-turn-helix domain-containing protein [Thalassomonas viridans]
MENTKLIRLNQWILDPLENHLIKEDNTFVPLEAKYVKLLVFLAESLPQVISREQLMQEVWDNRCIEYTTISSAISRLRKILGGERDDFIKTHLKRGYSLTCRVEYLSRTELLTTNTPPAANANHVQKGEETKQEFIAKADQQADEYLVDESIKPVEQEEAQDKTSEVLVTVDANNTVSNQTDNDSITGLVVKNISNKPKRRLLTKPFYKLYSLLATLILVIVLWQLTQPVTPSPKILTKHDVPEEPLTYLEGWEYAPSLSPDKALLAFTHQADHASSPRIVIQDIQTKQSIALEPGSISPYWSPSGNELFYMSMIQDNCTIKKVSIKRTLATSNSKEIIQCNPYLPYMTNTGIAVSPDLNWLYYTSADNDKPPALIKRYHLKSHYVETITAPPGKYQGDAGLRLSPDGTKLAFKRYADDHSESIMLLELNTGETNSLLNKSTLANQIAWSPFGTHVFYLEEREKILSAINVYTGENTSLYQYESDAAYPLVYSDTEILLTFGFGNIADINLLNLGNNKLSSPWVSSSFRDHSAALYKLNNTERIAFSSTRSGNRQIWLKEGDQLQQLTNFKDKAYIYQSSFSADGENILFIRDDKLYVLNIPTKQVQTVFHPNETVKNITWLCHSNDNILTTVLENGNWYLDQINIHTQTAKRLASGITSIHSQCGNNGSERYFASTTGSKGIYQLDDNWEFNNKYHYFPDVHFDYNLDWAVGNDAIYRITLKKEVIKVDFATGERQKVDIGNTNTLFITIHHNSLLMNDYKTANTYIGKITISDLNRRLSK